MPVSNHRRLPVSPHPVLTKAERKEKCHAFFLIMTVLSFAIAVSALGCADNGRPKPKWDGGGPDTTVPPACGDEVISQQEECDDGNRLDGDGCSPLCTVEIGWICDGEPSVCQSQCGNGELNTGEQCDGSNLGGNTCTTIPGGYTSGTLKCSASCLFDTTECILPSCGNENIDPGEDCDDGNTSNHDACLNNCQLATCGDGYVWNGSEECDDGNTSNTDDCLNSCQSATCGDGYLWAGNEECDDGNTSNTDACLFGCVNASCGDGYLWSGHEECDDGNDSNQDSCVEGCINASCGDGFVWLVNEECDDANTVEGDGCSANCTQEPLPVLHHITTFTGGWSSEIVTYHNDAHAPREPVVAATDVSERGEAYVFTRNTYHIIDLPSRLWTAHGPLTSRFPGVSGPNITYATGVSDSGATESTIYIMEGEWFHQFTVDNATGAITANAENPQLLDWSSDPGNPPDPNQVRAAWTDLENAEGWVDGSPEQICGGASTTIERYLGFITPAGSLYLWEAGECFQFFNVLPLNQFEPFTAADAPLAGEIKATFFVPPTLYVITEL